MEVGRILPTEAAVILNVSPQFIRIAMQQGKLPIGTAVQMSSIWTYHISEKLLADYSGKDIQAELERMRENPDTGEQERVQVGTREVVNGERERLMIIQDRCMKQCRQGASDFGMTVSSRCRLVVPKAKETKPENKFAKYASS